MVKYLDCNSKPIQPGFYVHNRNPLDLTTIYHVRFNFFSHNALEVLEINTPFASSSNLHYRDISFRKDSLKDSRPILKEAIIDYLQDKINNLSSSIDILIKID